MADQKPSATPDFVRAESQDFGEAARVRREADVQAVQKAQTAGYAQKLLNIR